MWSLQHQQTKDNIENDDTKCTGPGYPVATKLEERSSQHRASRGPDTYCHRYGAIAFPQVFRLHIVCDGRESKYPNNGAGESLQSTTCEKKEFYVTRQYTIKKAKKKSKEKKKEVALYWSLRKQWQRCLSIREPKQQAARLFWCLFYRPGNRWGLRPRN